MARMGRDEVYTVLWWENLSEMYHLEDLGLDGREYENGISRDRKGVLTGFV